MTEKQEEPTKPTPESEIITIAGGVDMEVTHKDGTKETVKVRQIPATKILDFAIKLADEANSISIYCDKPIEWVDTLDLSSLNAVAEKGLELNRPFLAAWYQRRAKWTDITSVGAIAELQKKVNMMELALQSGNFAPPSPTTTASPRPR